MRISYDAKRIFHNNTGLGNYGREVVRILHQNSNIERFFLFNTKKSSFENILPQDKISIIYPKGWFWKKLSSLWRMFAINKQIVLDNPDIYHGLSGEIPIGLSKNIASIVSIHDLIFLSHPHYYNPFDRLIYKLKFKYAARRADLVIAISEQTKRDIIKYLKVEEDKIEVAYQGCNAAYKVQYNHNQKENIVKKYGLPSEFVLNVGTIQERKNVLTLVKAIHHTNLHLVIIGSEKKYAKKVHKYVNDHDLSNRVHFLKNVPLADLAIIYQLAKIFCYPSICEGFGIPIIEALFSKTPVITSQGGCFPEAGGPSTAYINPNDSDALKKKLEELTSDESLRKSMIEKGYAYAQRFSDENVANHLIELYKSVL
ncbi:glycosyltransferase family 4 protein [Flagellimonas meridianipacifica]|uniref:Glycosyltransferase involved in cell wall biosynthesis n=1 Tax=Flagellimonas meridianipacifica TaxID=1080225 RepID=A0A2T0M9F9_9FLAO|nr:glycosyltransferase family 1 protein [Allomuricauda pacifica]PRX54108.1 glycosyltransferase involved in cell wall biosynthesis [Allomuricauda pacifica]